MFGWFRARRSAAAAPAVEETAAAVVEEVPAATVVEEVPGSSATDDSSATDEAPQEVGVVAPVEGRLVPLTEVPDPVFSQKLLGDGFAVEPTQGQVGSPVAGEVMMVAETRHAFGVRTDQGAEFLIHVGIDTVTLKGEGFTLVKAVGDRVEAGEVVLDVDLAVVGAAAPSLAIPVVLTNGTAFELGPVDLSAAYGDVVATAVSR